MNINQLKYFLAVAQLHSMNKAAESLFVSHQCLSASIRRLEDELGSELFERTNQGAFLNKNGEIIYKMAEKVLQEIENAKKELNGCLEQKVEVLRINFSIGLNAINFLDMVKEFKKENSKISIFVQETSSAEAIESLNKEYLDLIYVGLSKDFNEKNLSSDCIVLNTYQEKILCLISYGHPLAQCKSISFESVVNYPLVLYQRTIDNEKSEILKKITKYNTYPDIALITDNIDVHNEAIADGNGIGFISDAITRSGVLNEKLAALGLVSIPLKGGLTPQIVSLTTKNAWEKKKNVICAFEDAFKKTMWLKNKKNL